MISSLFTVADVAKAEAWIARNGQPSVPLVADAIRFSASHGDPLGDNPFRRALLAVAGR